MCVFPGGVGDIIMSLCFFNMIIVNIIIMFVAINTKYKKD